MMLGCAEQKVELPLDLRDTLQAVVCLIMDDATHKQHLDAMHRMNEKQLRAIRTKASALLSVTGDTGSEVEDRPYDDWLLSALFSELKARGLGAFMPTKRLVRLSAYNTFVEDADHVRPWLEKNTGASTTAEKVAVGTVVARAYAQYLSGWSELSITSMLRHIRRMPEAVERAFPGYVEAGMLTRLIHAQSINSAAVCFPDGTDRERTQTTRRATSADARRPAPSR